MSGASIDDARSGAQFCQRCAAMLASILRDQEPADECYATAGLETVTKPDGDEQREDASLEAANAHKGVAAIVQDDISSFHNVRTPSLLEHFPSWTMLCIAAHERSLHRTNACTPQNHWTKATCGLGSLASSCATDT